MAVTEAPVLRSNLREQIKGVMLQRIVSGAYPPGARLVETRIAHELGVSQAPVREALRDLENLMNLEQIGRPHGSQLHVLPVKWVGTTASPVRAVATVEEAEP